MKGERDCYGDAQTKKQRTETADNDSDLNSASRNLSVVSNYFPRQTEQSTFDDRTTDEYEKNQANNVERKRVREQKRRTDITNAVDLLVQVLVQINMPNVQTAIHQENQKIPSRLSDQAVTMEHLSAGNTTSSGIIRPGAHQLPYNRSEIISYAKEVLERIHQENVALKHEIECLKAQLSTLEVRFFVSFFLRTMLQFSKS